MRLHYFVNSAWLRLVKLLYKPTLVFVLKAWSADFSNRGGKMSTAIFFPLSSVSIAFIAYQL